MADNVTQVDGRGVFKGSDEQLCNSIDALLDLNAKGAVSHRVPGMAVTLLEAAADRIAATRPAPKADSALVGELRGILAAQKSHCDWTHDKAVAGFMEANGATILAALSDRDVVLEEARAALEPFGNPDLLMQIADDDDEEWAKFRLLCSDYRRAGRSLARIDAALKGGSK